MNWNNRQTKRKNDALLESYMLPLWNSGREQIDVLSLPAEEWLWERGIALKHPDQNFVFSGIEANRKVHRRQVLCAERLNYEQYDYGNATFIAMPEPTKWFNALSMAAVDPDLQFDIIYADYMGAWAGPKLHDLVMMFSEKLLKPGGYFLMTLSMTRDGYNNFARKMAIQYGKLFHDIPVIDDRSDWRESGTPQSTVVQRARGIAAYVRDLARKYGQTVQILPPHVYYNTTESGRSYPEIGFCFRKLTTA